MMNQDDSYGENGNRDREDRQEGERDRERRGRRGDRGSRFSGGPERDRSPRGRKRANRVLVSNIPYEYRWQELKDLFREQVGEVAFVELFNDENDKARGVGVVEFATSELAKEAIEKMHRYELKGRKLVVKEDDGEMNKFGRSASRGGGGGGGGDRRRDNDRSSHWNEKGSANGPASSSSAKYSNTYGLSPQFLESLNIMSPLVPRVFIANLDYKVDDKKLREVFKLAGRVLSAEISLDKDGKSRGFGVVEYEHPVEAVQAISMLHNQTLYDRRLSVRMDRIDKGDGPPKLPEGLKGLGMGLGTNGIPLQDVARNLPNTQAAPVPSPVANLTAAVANTPALAAAALVNNLFGAQANSSADLSSLATNQLSQLTSAALTSANPIAAQFLGNAAPVAPPSMNPFASSSGNRDFDSLGGALSSSSAFNLSSSGRNQSSFGSSGNSASSNRQDTTVIIKNLPAGTTWVMLKEKCQQVGEVKFAEMRGNNTGVIQFMNHWDAQKAINVFDGMRVDGKIVEARFYYNN